MAEIDLRKKQTVINVTYKYLRSKVAFGILWMYFLTVAFQPSNWDRMLAVIISANHR